MYTFNVILQKSLEAAQEHLSVLLILSAIVFLMSENIRPQTRFHSLFLSIKISEELNIFQV